VQNGPPGFLLLDLITPIEARMTTSSRTDALLLIIAIALLAIAFRPYLDPTPVRADATPYPFYIEPGYQMLRAPDGSKQVYGRVVIDMRNGKVWGFPTYTADVYPVNTTDTKPATSKPFVLGKFAFDDTEK
jgi:hypothetical protein